MKSSETRINTQSSQETLTTKSTTSIDFRKARTELGESLVREIIRVYDAVSAKTRANEIIDQAKKLHKNLEKHYKKSEHAAEIKANEVYSQFLQHLIYFITHNYSSPTYVQHLCLAIIQEDKFFYVNEGHMTFWKDPSNGYSALHAIIHSSIDEQATALLKRAETASGEKKTASFRDFISHCNHYGDSALHFAVEAQNKALVEKLIAVAREALDILDFQKFMAQANDDEYSPLRLAVCSENQELFNILLIATVQALGGLQSEA